MAEILTHDNSVPAEVMESQASDEAESLAIGEKIVAEQEARLAGKYKTTEELESAYLELQKKLGNQEEQAAEQEQLKKILKSIGCLKLIDLSTRVVSCPMRLQNNSLT